MFWRTYFVTLIITSILSLAVAQVITLAQTTTSNITVKDGGGRIIGFIEGNKVFDASHHALGSFKDGRTYNSNGQVVAIPEVPGILFCKH